MKQLIDATTFTEKGISVNTLTMDLGKFGLSIKEDDSGKLIFHIQVNTRNQRDFENSLKKLVRLFNGSDSFGTYDQTVSTRSWIKSNSGQSLSFIK